MFDLTLADTVILAAPVAAVAAWFEGLDRHYRDWHPGHNRLTVLSGSLAGHEAEIEFDEFLGRWRYVYRVRILRYDAAGAVGMRYVGVRLRDRLVFREGTMALVPVEGGCRFTATVTLRSGRLLGGLFRGRVGALLRHMAEEGQALQTRFGRRG